MGKSRVGDAGGGPDEVSLGGGSRASVCGEGETCGCYVNNWELFGALSSGWGSTGQTMRGSDRGVVGSWVERECPFPERGGFSSHRRAYRDACMLLGGQEGSEDRDESETRLHLRYSMALQLLPLVRRIRRVSGDDKRLAYAAYAPPHFPFATRPHVCAR